MDKERAKYLLTLISRGDTEALKAFYSEFGGAVLAAAYRVLFDRELAKDILNKVIFDVYNKSADLCGLSNPLGYIYTMAHNAAIDYKRKIKEEPTQLVPEAAAETDSEILERLFVNSIIEKMEPDERQIFMLKASHGYSFVEISRICGLTYKQTRTKYLKAEKLFIFLYAEGKK